MTEAGLVPGEELLGQGGAVPESGFRGLLALLEQPRPPTAVYVGSVLAAIGALAAARHAGLRVPDDLSIVGHHDTWVADHLEPPLTVVRLPLETMGREAVNLLVDLIEGKPARQVLVSSPAPEIVLRSSTAPPPRPQSVRRRR